MTYYKTGANSIVPLQYIFTKRYHGSNSPSLTYGRMTYQVCSASHIESDRHAVLEEFSKPEHAAEFIEFLAEAILEERKLVTYENFRHSESAQNMYQSGASN